MYVDGGRKLPVSGLAVMSIERGDSALSVRQTPFNEFDEVDRRRAGLGGSTPRLHHKDTDRGLGAFPCDGIEIRGHASYHPEIQIGILLMGANQDRLTG